MANQEHVNILRQGVAEWNGWREQHPDIHPDLSLVNLGGANLSSANLSLVNLGGANLHGTDLGGADLSSSNLNSTNLGRTNLNHAILSYSDLGGADFWGTDLSYADLSYADLSYATFLGVILGDVDLRTVKGLETVRHDGPSTIGTNTLERSQGHIPEIFLRGTGLSDTFIENIRPLVQKPIQYYTCFISYSSKNSEFVERLYTDMQRKNVQCWLDKEDLKIGDKFRNSIDEAIRFHDKLLLVLSEHSVESSWVEKEVETAFDKERQHKKLVLFPVKLDEKVMQTDEAWAADIRRMRHIGDFSHWKEHDFYQKTLSRLLRDLKAERI